MKTLVSMFTALTLAVVALFAGPAYADGGNGGNGGNGGSGTVSVMKHVCPSNIKSKADFDALGSFLKKVLTCPVITREGDQGTGAANAGQANFDFSVAAGGMTQRISSAKFMPAKLCETDVNADANGNGKIEADVCVDVSHYVYSGVPQGSVRITEIMPPAGHRFGSIEFTPNSGDEKSLVSFGGGVIRLNTANDNDVMVHVYNFKTGPMPSQMPDTGVADGATGMLALVALVTLIAGLALTAGARRRRTQH